MTTVKKSIITAVLVALCVVLPQAFHSIPNAGSIWLPMHLPVLLCGLICGWQYGLLCGIIGPCFSSLMTGMPPASMLPVMVIELFVYGLLSGLFMKIIRTKNLFADLYISLILSLLSGKIIAGIARALIFSYGKYSIAVWATSYFVTGLPGIAVQLAILPMLVYILTKATLIPLRYQKKLATKEGTFEEASPTKLNEQSIMNYFDSLAESWDNLEQNKDEIINILLDNAKINGGSVLDVACGTGVLVPFYLERGAEKVLGIDLSEKMIERAKTKFSQSTVSFKQANAVLFSQDELFDSIVVYNAFPHFAEPDKLIENLSKLLKADGKLTICHSFSREALNSHHKNTPEGVSVGLMSIEELESLISKHLKVTFKASNDTFYQIVAEK